MKQITTEELLDMLASNETVHLIDVREISEYADGHIPSAVNIPLSVITERVGELDKQKDYHIVCRSGGRSGQATAYLDSLGFSVTNVEGGMLDWDGDVE